MTRKRALVLAGGGIKVAFQAGVLEVLLPTLKAKGDPPFVRVEACSSGIFNAAMMAAGFDAGLIADNWRRLRPLRALGINWGEVLFLSWGESWLRWGRFMRKIVKARSGWGLTFPVKPTHPGVGYRFNAYNVTDQRIVSFSELDEARFRACIALPRWYPPVQINGDPDPGLYVDAVFTTDSNADAVLDVGPDLKEVWVIWSVDLRGGWRNGWVSNYFRVLEQSAAGAYRRERERLKAAGFVPASEVKKGGPLPDKVLFEIAADVPAHYLFTFRRRAVRNAVKQGNDIARIYLKQHRRLWNVP